MITILEALKALNEESFNETQNKIIISFVDPDTQVELFLTEDERDGFTTDNMYEAALFNSKEEGLTALNHTLDSSEFSAVKVLTVEVDSTDYIVKEINTEDVNDTYVVEDFEDENEAEFEKEFDSNKPDFYVDEDELEDDVDTEVDNEVTIDANPEGESTGIVDDEGLTEDPNFNLSEIASDEVKGTEESLSEAFDLNVVKQDTKFANLPNKTLNAIFRILNDDNFGEMDTQDFIDIVNDYGNLTNLALDLGDKLTIEDFKKLVEGDPKFDEVVRKICKESGWITDDGAYIDAEGNPLNKKPTTNELIHELLSLKDKKAQTINILRDAYEKGINGKVLEGCSHCSELNEDVQSSLPVRPLNKDQALEWIDTIPLAEGPNKATGEKGFGPTYFSVGYFKELSQTNIAAKYRGGRGSTVDDPKIRIFKATEYDEMYTGAAYENTSATKEWRKQSGKERVGDRTGFGIDNENGSGAMIDKIGYYQGNSEPVLQAYVKEGSKMKTQYYISENDGDLRAASREEVATFLTPAQANALLQARTPSREKVTDDQGNTSTQYNAGATINRLYVKNIYYLAYSNGGPSWAREELPTLGSKIVGQATVTPNPLPLENGEETNEGLLAGDINVNLDASGQNNAVGLGASQPMAATNLNPAADAPVEEGILSVVGDVVGGVANGVKDLLASDEAEKKDKEAE